MSCVSTHDCRSGPLLTLRNTGKAATRMHVCFISPPFYAIYSSSSPQVVSIGDLDYRESLNAATRIRCNAGRPVANPESLSEAVGLVGGRLSYLNKISNATDMVAMAEHLLEVEKAWLLSQIGAFIRISCSK